MKQIKNRIEKIKNLKQNFEKLLISKRYYISIPPGLKDSTMSDYWGEIKDPDGNIRNRKDDKILHLKDVDYIIDFISKKNPGTILDIGCGPGWLLSNIPSGWKKFGNETDSVATSMSNDKNITFSNNNLSEKSFDKNFFDIIIMHHVIEHIKKPEKIIKLIKTFLKKNGILIIATPDFDSGAARYFKENYRMLHDPTHISLFSQESMFRFLRDNRFEIFKVEFPFFNTRFFNEDNMLRMFEKNRISPPFYGNFMTFFCYND